MMLLYMKKIFRYIGCALFAGLTLTACSPDSFDGADETKIPTVAGQDFTMEVDQEVNQVRVSYPETAGTYPVWIFNGATYSTLNNAGWANSEAGTYTVEMKLANRNGISQGSLKKTFTFNESKVNYTTLLNRIADKDWRIDNAEPAHLACGPYGGDGSGWWSAAPDEKKDFGVYDDRIRFTIDSNTGGAFTYDPGADGMTYINIGCTRWDKGDATADFDFPNQEQKSSFQFKRGKWTDAEGQVIDVDYLVLAPNTFFPYISADSQYENPRFRIETLTASKMVLVYENEPAEISWRFIFTSKEGEKKFEGFDPNSQYNMWKGITPTMEFWYAPGWSQIADPEFTDGGNDYTIILPQATAEQWQAQVKFHTDLTTSAANNYDFSTIINSDKDLNGATVKLVLDGDDGVFYFTDRIDLKAGEDYVFWKSDMPGIDMNKVMLVLDFGGCQENTTVNVRSIVLKNHADDDGTVLPEEGGGDKPAVTWVAVDSPDNLGADFNKIGTMQFWWADGSWTQIGNPQFSFSNGVYTIKATENGGSEWQAQNSIHNASVDIEAGELYDIRAKIEASADLDRYTFKICAEDDDDNTLVYNGTLTLEAGEQYVEFVGVKAQKNGEDSGFKTAKLFVDLGGAPVDFVFSLSEIIIQKHGTSGGGSTKLDYNSDANLWKAVDNGDAFVSVTPWFANGSWTKIDDPEWSHKGKVWKLTIPEGMGGDQWQGQFPINTTLATSQNDKYSFSCTIMADKDCNGVTIKLTESDDAAQKHDNNFYFADRHNIQADEPYEYTVTGVTLPLNDAHALSLFFDFGGSPVGTHVEISDIILMKE